MRRVPVVVQVGAGTETKDLSPAIGTWRLVATPVPASNAKPPSTATSPARVRWGRWLRRLLPHPTPGRDRSRHQDPTTVSSTKRKASFRFSAVGVASGFQCALKPKKSRKKPSFKPCTSPKTYGNLAAGRYTFEVRASGAAGPDASPARKSITVTTPD